MDRRRAVRSASHLRPFAAGAAGLCVLLGTLHPACGADAPSDAVVARIGFGSCAEQDREQRIWQAVNSAKPERFLLLGDNIYADTTDVAVLREKYRLFGLVPGFRALRAACPVLATWDDHDYGADDVGIENPIKRESQQAFLDFFGAAKDDVRRTRDGIYAAHVFGPPGRRVQVILLDGRFFRSPPKKSKIAGEPGEGRIGRYVPHDDPQTTVLGPAQWTWLAEQLRVPAELRIVASGIQVVADEHHWEHWGNFPHERRRLFRLIRDAKAGGVVFVSGDRHLAEISRLAPDDRDGVGYPLFDVTSSSLTTPSFGKTKAGTRFSNEINSRRVGVVYFETNFGMILVDWTQSDPVVRMQVRDEQGDVVLQQRVRLSELQPPAAPK